MSIYLQDNSVVLDGGSVATSSDCCCGGVCCDCDGNCDNTVTQEDCESNGGQWFPTDTCDDNPCDTLTTGGCCDGINCSIKTQDCCQNDGGTYQGDDTPCDPNPCNTCAGCGFYNPDDGLTYLTKTYSYSIDNSNCPSTPIVNCIGPSGAPCHPIYLCGQNPCICPAIILGGTRTESVIAEEHYTVGTCVYSSSNENIELELSCACQIFTNDCLTGGGDPGAENCAIDSGDCRSANGCPSDCSGVTPPFGDCSIVTTTVTYSNQCIP